LVRPLEVEVIKPWRGVSKKKKKKVTKTYRKGTWKGKLKNKNNGPQRTIQSGIALKP